MTDLVFNSNVQGASAKKHDSGDGTFSDVFAPSADQDPVFDNSHGTKNSITSSATIITPPTGCKYLNIVCSADIVVNTDGNTAVDDGTSMRIVANLPQIIPVIGGVAVKALSLVGTAVVHCTPFKVRP